MSRRAPSPRRVDAANDSFFTDPRRACAHLGPDLFFSDYGHCPEAKAICRRCPVIDDCREYAIPVVWLSGTWGGTQRQGTRTHPPGTTGGGDVSRRTAAPRRPVHQFVEDPGITDWRGRPLCTCSQPRDVRTHRLPDTNPDVTAAEARRLGEHPEREDLA